MREGFSDAHQADIAIRPTRKRKHPPPYSIRFTDTERAILKRDAGNLSEAAYIRSKRFPKDTGVEPRLTRKRPAPSLDHVILAKLLGQLGQSHLSSNLSDIARAASLGAFPVSPELELELAEASKAVLAMKQALVTALGVKAR
ncbi:MAG: hypothetical protein AAGA72_09310 [Pseudomonadota bacterium]